jgi:transcriptional regulator with PAS, ATPase and Fis domain
VPISTEQNPSLRNIVVDQSQPHIISSSKENLIEVEQSLSLAEIEKETIIKALKKHRNRKDAARELGISERTLYRKVKDYNLE